MLKFALGAALFCAATPAAALQDEAEDADASAQPSGVDLDAKPPAPVDAVQALAGRGRPKLWFQVGIAPEIVSETPFSNDADATEISWTLGIEPNLFQGLKTKITLGPSATVDSDHDSGESSRFNFAVDLRSEDPILWGLTPSFTYKFGQRYTAFFDDRDGREHTFDTALNYVLKFEGGKFGGGKFELGLVSRRLESTRLNSDYWSLRLLPKLTIPVFGGAADLAFGAVFERRLYDDVNLSIGRTRRDWRAEAAVGIDLARGINAYFNSRLVTGQSDILREFLIGARWIGIDSNVEDEDNSTYKFTPSISIRIGF